MPERHAHQEQVRSFLQKQFQTQNWSFSLPHGTGMETYFVEGNEQRYFVKVGVSPERYLVMAAMGLTPPLLACGELESGVSIIVQPYVPGRNPSRRDYREQLERVATLVQSMHTDPRLRETLEPAPSILHRDAGARALDSLRKRWEAYRTQVPRLAGFVDQHLEQLESKIQRFSTNGLVASHSDICNANWLFAADGTIYLVDLDSMTLDDPAFDLGALLWWYYPPDLRELFLEIAGYPYDDMFKSRMQVRMAIHCLSITLPREPSFDRFHPEHYEKALEDFRAVVTGRENPQGYGI